MNMKQIKAGLFQAVGLLLMGVVGGAVAGILELLSGGSADDMARVGAAVFPYLALLMPVWLFLLNLAPSDTSLFETLPSSLLVLVLAGVAGGILGAAAFLVPATNLPVILAGKNPSELSAALQGAIGQGSFVMVVTVTTAAAVLIALWNYVRMRPRRASG